MRHRLSLLTIALVVAAGNVSAVFAQEGQVLEWRINGVRREGLVFLPRLEKRRPAPLILAFHGHGGTMQSAARMGFQRQWPEAIVLYLQGLPTPTPRDPQGRRPGWNAEDPGPQNRDLKLVDAAIGKVRELHPLDERRVYACGFSNGATFTYLLWLARPQVFAAYGPCAGVIRSPGNRSPAPILHVVGEKDKVAAYHKQMETLAMVRQIDGCRDRAAEWAPGCKLYTPRNREGAPLVIYTHPGGHVFPPEAAALMVRFFKERTRR